MKKNFFFSAYLILSTLVFFSCGKKAEEAPSSYYESEDHVVAVDTTMVSESEESSVATETGVNTNTPKDRKFKKTAKIEFKVKNTIDATEKIEDLIFAKGGYIVSSDLSNRNNGYYDIVLSKDSVLEVQKIVVENYMEYKVPTVYLDTILRQLKQYVVFLDSRQINLEDLTYEHEQNIAESQVLDQYTKRQESKIDAKGNKLKDITNAEDKLLQRKLDADATRIKNKQLNYDIQFSTLNIHIYQASILHKEVKINTEYIVEKYEPNFWVQMGYRFADGWSVFKAIVLFLVNIWGVILLLVILFFVIRYFRRKTKHKKAKVEKEKY